MLLSEYHNLPRWNGRERPFHEAYYLKLNDPSLGVALWLRYTFLAPVRGDMTASVWAIFFDSRDHSKNFAVRETIPAGGAIFKKGRFHVNIGGALLDNSSASGRVSSGARDVEWDLNWYPTDECYLPLPFPLYAVPYPPTRAVMPVLASNLRGHFAVNGVKYPCSNLKVHQGHVWGRRYSKGWAWADCSLFNEDACAVLELVANRNGLGVGILKRGKEGARLVVSGRAGPSGWDFSGVGLTRRVEGRVIAGRNDVAGVTYDDPSGGKRYCYNTKVADLVMDIYRRKGLHWELAEQLTSFGTAAFEYVTDRPVEGYSLML